MHRPIKIKNSHEKELVYIYNKIKSSDRIFESILLIVIVLLVVFYNRYFYEKYHIIILLFLIMNMSLLMLNKRIRHSLPVLIIQVSGVFRFILIPFTMVRESISITDNRVFLIMTMEIMASYTAILLFSIKYKKIQHSEVTLPKRNAKNDMNNLYKLKTGISALIVFLVGGIYIITHRDVISLYLELSSSKKAVIYDSGFFGLLVSAFFLLIYIFLVEWISRLRNIPVQIKVISMIILSVLLINGSAIKGDNVSRWTIIIISYIAFRYICLTYPKYKTILLIGFGVALVFAVTIGTVMKFGGNATGSYATIERALESQFTYKSLNAYFSGPKNLDTALKVKETINHQKIPIIKLIVSDSFANFPLLNKILSNTATQSNLLFNYQIYGSTIASDQIIPLAGQFYIYFGYLFFIPIGWIVYGALSIYFSRMEHDNKLVIYCKIYMMISLSLINCLSYTIMLQNLWIRILPIWIIDILNLRTRQKLKIKILGMKNTF